MSQTCTKRWNQIELLHYLVSMRYLVQTSQGHEMERPRHRFCKAFMVAPVNVLRALTALGKTGHIDDDTFSGLEQFICSVRAQTRHGASPHN